MTEQIVFDQLQQIFRDVFENQALKLATTDTANDVENWNSIAHVGLIAAIEEHFDISFDLDELIEMNGVEAIIRNILVKINR